MESSDKNEFNLSFEESDPLEFLDEPCQEHNCKEDANSKTEGVGKLSHEQRLRNSSGIDDGIQFRPPRNGKI